MKNVVKDAGKEKHVGKLKITTPSDREIAMTRVFDAPRDLVFDAWTKPELLKRWLGVFGNWSFAVCEVDLRVGGKYRYVWRGKDARKWRWAASSARSCGLKGWSSQRSSTTPGIRATRRTRPSSLRRAARRRSRPRCGTRPRKLATVS